MSDIGSDFIGQNCLMIKWYKVINNEWCNNERALTVYIRRTRRKIKTNSYKPSQRKSAFIETIHGADNGGDLIADFTNIGYVIVLQDQIN